MKWIWSLLLAHLAVLAFPLSAHAVVQAILGKPSTGAVDNTIPAAAGPMSVIVGDNGSLMAKRGTWFETVPGMFFAAQSSVPTTNWHLRVKGEPPLNETYGVRDTAPTPISNGPPTGNWTAASPARIDTVMQAGTNLFEIKQTVLYVAPELSFRVIWDIRNISAQTVPFIFGISADLFIESDAGEGVFIDGANRFIGGRNTFTGTVGGVAQVTSSQIPGEAGPTVVPPWASWEEGDPFPVTRRLSSQDAFLNTINPLFMDNGVGVSWNDRATAGLPAGQTARYEVIWQLSRPPVTALRATPAQPPPAAPDATAASEAVPATPAATTSAVAADATAAADKTAPVLSALRVSPGAATGTPKIAFRLSEGASVVLRIARRAQGRQRTVKTLRRAGLKAGSRRIAGGIGRLAPGRYVVIAHAVDAAGNRGARRSTAFRITRR